MIGAAAGAAMAISAFAISSHINDAHSINFLDSICAMQPESSALSLPYVEKYACMYSIKPEMLQAAVSYILISGENIDFGAVSRYSSDPEQLTMSVAKRMHDIMQKRGENYPAILAEMYSGEQAVHSATRLGMAGRYVDFRMLPPVQVAKVASTIAGSGYYAKERTRRVVSGWRR